MRYKVNDIVLYGVDGVCKVTNIVEKHVGKESIEYYVLESCSYENTTVYVPTASEKLVARMRQVMTSGDILDLIKNMPDEETIWVEDENERKVRFEEILVSNDRKVIMTMIKTLYLHQQELKANKKKMRASDEKMMRDAEKRLYDEFAYALNMKSDQVLPFIRDILDGQQKVVNA